jgi:hypothetical protein
MMTNQSVIRAVMTISCAALITCSMQATAHDDFPSDGTDSGDMLADLVFVRPLGLVGTVIGSALFIVALPFTLPSRNVEETAKAFVVNPAEYTFDRRLGDFNHCGASRHVCGDD